MKKKKKQVTKTRSKNVKIKKGNITKSMSFGEILEKHPEVAGVLMKSGLHCFGCSMASFETLEQGAIMHGINPDKLVKKLNKKLKK